MKKILFLVVLIIVLPYLIITLLVRDNQFEFQFVENMNIRVLRENGNIDLVPFEDYIVGVLAGEMPVSFELEALKAQAVAARSYAMSKMIENYENEYDVADTVRHQVYLDEDHLRNIWGNQFYNRINRLRQAVNETRLEYLSYNEQVAEALYFSTSVGRTEYSEEVFLNKKPYLRSVDSSWDEISPAFEDSATFSSKEFFEKLGLEYSNELDIEIILTTSTGRIRELKINGTEFNGVDVRMKLGLRSNHFQIKKNNKEIEIATRGFGHGVGMSQWGAQAKALKGYTYREILAHYYTGTIIKKI